jgi:hypothetical protein
MLPGDELLLLHTQNTLQPSHHVALLSSDRFRSCDECL